MPLHQEPSRERPRRHGPLPWLAVVLLLCHAVPAPARADQVPDVVVLCEPSLQRSLVAAWTAWRARTQVPVRVLVASLEQNAQLVVQGVRADILVGIGAERIDKAQQLGALALGNPVVVGRAPVVLAARAGGPQPRLLAPGGTLDDLLGQGRIGLVDPPFGAAGADARAALEAAGLWPGLAGRSMGAVTTNGLKSLLAEGSVKLAVLYAPDLAGEPSLSVAATFATPAKVVVAAIASEAKSQRTTDFLYFLAHDGQAALQQNGMEPP